MKLRAIDVPTEIQIAKARESRNSMGGSEPLFTFTAGGDLIIIDGTDVSTLSGRLRNWVSAHLQESGVESARAVQTGDVIAIETESGLAFNLAGEPEPIAPEPAPLVPDSTPPGIPIPDLPSVPTDVPGWSERIEGAMLRQIPTLPPVDERESVDAYGERALLPLSLTMAEAAKEKTQLTLALDHLYAGSLVIDESWVPLIEASGLTFSPANAPLSDAHAIVPSESGNIAIIAEGRETPEEATERVAAAHA